MVVEKSTGGRWRFELRLEATQPDVDGSVTIQAAPGQSALGAVLLYSPTNQPESFTCHFTHDSSISFDVSPSEVGILARRYTAYAGSTATVCGLTVALLMRQTLSRRLPVCMIIKHAIDHHMLAWNSQHMPTVSSADAAVT